jgi:hypothetical protein
MAEGTTAVDFITLQDFQTRLENHLNEVGDLLGRMTRDLGNGPELGGFHDAVQANLAYWDRWAVQYSRIQRLANALNAAHEANRQILDSYKTTEELNRAKVSDLSSQFESLSIVTEGLARDAI